MGYMYFRYFFMIALCLVHKAFLFFMEVFSMGTSTNHFTGIFQHAMELSILGLYEKEEMKSKHNQNNEYIQSPLLKKALDKFSLLNITFSLYDQHGAPIFPTDEASLIKTFNFPINDVIDRLPESKRQYLIATDWYMDDAYVSIGFNHEYYCTPELLDKLNERIYRKVKSSPYKELELQSQKFIELLFDREQREYEEIRNFFQQKESVYITGRMFIETEAFMQFKKDYPEIFVTAYRQLNIDHTILKICDHCGLVLKEMNDGMLYCVSDRCERKTNGFTRYQEMEVAMEEIWVLRQNVARYIYYPGLLEQRIKEFLIKEGLKYKIWPEKDAWDFKFIIGGQTWIVDAKDVKNPNVIKRDIWLKEENDDLSNFDKILYIVPHDRKTYVDAVNHGVRYKEKIQCLTYPNFERMVKEMQVVSP